MRGSPNAFMEVRPEIWLWPAAAMAYFFTIHDSMLVLALFLLSLCTGATTFKMHEGIQAVLKNGPKDKQISAVRQRMTDNTERGRMAMFGEIGSEFWETVTPDHPRAKAAVWVGVVLDIILFVVLFLWLGVRVIRSPPPSVAAVSLFALPLLMLAAFGASLLWSA